MHCQIRVKEWKPDIASTCVSSSLQLTPRDTVFTTRHDFLYRKEAIAAQIRTVKMFAVCVSNTKSKACYCGCAREKTAGWKTRYSVADVQNSVFLPGRRGPCCGARFCRFPRVRGSRAQSSARAAPGPAERCCFCFSNALWSPATVWQRPASSLAKLNRRHLLKTVSSCRSYWIKHHCYIMLKVKPSNTCKAYPSINFLKSFWLTIE